MMEETEKTTTALSTVDGKSTYSKRAKDGGMKYTVAEVPPLHESLLLGFQHYLTMLGASVLVPLIVTPAMGASGDQTARVISSLFFVSGINTLLQTTIGDRLPIVQGGSFSYLPPTFGIIFNAELQAIEDDNERFLQTMRVLQGAIIVVGLVQVGIGYTGTMTLILKYLSPVTIAPVIAAIGLGLNGVGFNGVSACFPLGLVQLVTVVIFALHMRNLPVFKLFPVLLAITVTWVLGAILTATNVFKEGDVCRTDSNDYILEDSPWFRVPYPGQWGAPVFRAYAIAPMFGAMLASMVESVGDYYACASLSGAPPPTAGIMSRGLGSEGIGVLIAGLVGTANGTTSYSENIGAISVTGVGSRVVVQCGAILMILISCVAKFGALFATMPNSMTSGVYCAVFGLVAAVGLSNLQYVDMNSSRNQFIVGFALFNSLSVAGPGGYFATQPDNPFGTTDAAAVALALFNSPMLIAFMSAFTLDNTCSGTREERGLTVWDKVSSVDVNNDPEYVEVYSMPGFLAKLTHNFDYLEYFSMGWKMPPPPANGYTPGGADFTSYCCTRKPTSEDEETKEEKKDVVEA